MPIFFARPKKIGEKKGLRSNGACLFRDRIFAPLSADCENLRLYCVSLRLTFKGFCFHMPRRAMRPMLSRIAFRSQPPLGDPALPDEEPRGFWLRPQRRKQTGAGKSKLRLLEQASPFSIVYRRARGARERGVQICAYMVSAVG